MSANEKSSIGVAIRIRPLNDRENGTNAITRVVGKKIYINSPTNEEKSYNFDYVYDMHSTQDQLHTDIGSKIIDSAFQGYNSCIFAYGQTGSGKTYVMMGGDGSIEQQGLIPRICQDLFECQITHKINASINYKIEVSYLEIYSEQVYDLISNTAHENLRVRQHPELGPYVEGLSQIMVEDHHEIRRLIEQGNTKRTTAATLMNNRSSRSHAILTIIFTQIIDEPDLGKSREIVSKINLVDLAGSEKVLASGVTGVQFKEAININKSLSALSLVINKLATRPQSNKTKRSSTVKSVSTHIPFRDSVLTWILSESLGGNSKTFMIATISPSSINYAESYNTLKYANNAKQIVNTVHVNEDPGDKIIKLLRDEIEALKKQISTASGTITNEELEKLKDELLQREELMRSKEKTWEQKMDESRKVNEEIEQRYKKELAIKQAEFRAQVQSMDNVNKELSAEMNRIKSELGDQERIAQEKYQEELQRQQAELSRKQEEFEKSRIMDTAVGLHEYYEKKLESMRTQYEERIASKEREQNKTTMEEIKLLRENNQQMKKSLINNQTDLAQQMRKYTNERAILSKQIQQLQSRIHTLEQETVDFKKTDQILSSESLTEEIQNKLNEIDIKQKEYEKYKLLKEEEEKKFNNLQLQCEDLHQQIVTNNEKLSQIESAYRQVHTELEQDTAKLEQIKREYIDISQKFEIAHLEYNQLLVKKEHLHHDIVQLQLELTTHVEQARVKLQNPTLNDFINIKDGFEKIFGNLKTLNNTQT